MAVTILAGLLLPAVKVPASTPGNPVHPSFVRRATAQIPGPLLVRFCLSFAHLARELRSHFREVRAIMATRANILKLMQEIHGFARVTHRRPQPRPPALFLMEIRSQTHYSELPKRKLNIVFQMEELADFPHPVKITHLDRCALPVVVSHSD